MRLTERVLTWGFNDTEKAGCVSWYVCVLLHGFIRKWRHRPRPRPLCSRQWRRWQSRARWRRWTRTATRPAGPGRRPLRWRRGRWPRSWRANARRCSRHWGRSPWRPPSSWGSEKQRIRHLDITQWLEFQQNIDFCSSSTRAQLILLSDPCLQRSISGHCRSLCKQWTAFLKLFLTGWCKAMDHKIP